MNEQEFQARLGELIEQIEHLPERERERLRDLAAETRERHERMRDTISGLQESLDHLRVSVKYLVFDLEATRRENDSLRKMIDACNGGPRPEAGEDPDPVDPDEPQS